MINSINVSPATINPYNQSATISYTLNNSVNSATVSILDNNSAVRRTFYSAGTSTSGNSVSFNGRDDNGNILPRGTYTARVTVTNNVGSTTATTYVYLQY